MSISKIVKLSFVVCMICSCQSHAQEVRDTGNTIVESENTASQNNMFNMEILGRGFSNGGGFSVDVITGNFLNTPDSRTNLFMREKVTELSVTETRYTSNRLREIQEIYRYKDGLLISRYYSASDVDPNETYEYDSLGRCIRSGQDHTYTYPENQNLNEIERTMYYRGQYRSTEIIRMIENGYEVYTKRSNDSEASQKYLYENGLLMHIIGSYPKEGREWNWYDFTYENGLLKGIVNAASKKDDIRSIIKVLSYDGSNMLEMERQRFRQGVLEITEHWKFMNYDEYGNWHNAECYFGNDTLVWKYHRDIEYEKGT